MGKYDDRADKEKNRKKSSPINVTMLQQIEAGLEPTPSEILELDPMAQPQPQQGKLLQN